MEADYKTTLLKTVLIGGAVMGVAATQNVIAKAENEEDTSNQVGNIEAEDTEVNQESVEVELKPEDSALDVIDTNASAMSRIRMAVLSGWTTALDGKTYYYASSGALTGQQKIDGKWYHFNDEGVMSTGFTYLADQAKTVFYAEDGHMVYGQQKIDGHWYYFNENTGAMSTGWTYIKDQNKTVYYSTNESDRGQMLYGKQNINGSYYYLNTATGARELGIRTNNDGTVSYYTQNGAVTGQQKINGKWYHFDQNGVMSKGFTFIADQNKTVFYAEDGHMVYGQQKIDGHWYHFNENTGAMSVGWTYIKDQHKTVFYSQESADLGQMKYGYQKIGNSEFYFNVNSGAVYTGWASDNNGNRMYFYGTSGRLNRIGQQKIDGKWYHFDANGMMSTGFTYISDQKKTVYYAEDGHMLYGQQKINGNWYHFNESTGAMSTAWTYLKDQHKTVYYSTEQDTFGQMVHGETVIDGKYYYFKNDGIVQYGLSPEGVYYNKDGTKIASLAGEVTLDGFKYYFNTDTHEAVKNAFVTVESSGKTVYCDELGHYVYGQKKLNGYWYHFDENTGAMSTGLTYLKDQYKTVYYNSEGKMQYGQLKLDDDWYYFDISSGKMAVGKTLVPASQNGGYSKWVLYDQSGKMIRTNTVTNGTSYTIDSNTGAILSESAFMRGIDISSHNGNMDLSSYKDGFVIIRAGYGWQNEPNTLKNATDFSQLDTEFLNNVRKCEALGIPYGIYWYSYATDTTTAALEAQTFLKCLQGTHPALGVWMDEEYDSWKGARMTWNASTVTPIVNTFCDIVSNAGYNIGVYADYNNFKNNISTTRKKWVAHYGVNNDGTIGIDLHDYASIHQYTSAGGLDKNIMYDLSVFKR